MAETNEFRIVTRWQVKATIDEVAAVLSDAERLADWWGDVYLSARILAPGNADGLGRQVAVHSRGWLPYRLNWTATLVENRMPQSWAVTATGDLEGRGVWALTQQGAMAEVVYDWRVKAEKPILRRLSPLLAPVFAWNHRWAMARGQAGLRREVVRRREAASQVMRGG